MAKYKIIPSSRTIVRSPISIGHKAEKGVEAIEFDLTAWVETYGSGTLTVIMRRWGDAIPYPIALEIGEDNKATWTLSDIDTAKAGMAYAQLNYIVGDEVVKKSDIYTFRVMDSLTGEGEPPEAYESWLEHLTHLAAEAMAEVLDIEGIVTDKTLMVDGGIADGKATGDALALKADKSTTYTKTEVDQMIEDVEVETDTTLEISGAAADAAETGRQIGLLKADLSDLEEYMTASETPDSSEFEIGAISSSTGGNVSLSTRIRTRTFLTKRIFGINVLSGYKYAIYAYEDNASNTYKGSWNGSTFASVTTWLTTYTDGLQLGDCKIRVAIAKSDDSSIDVSDSNNLILNNAVYALNSDMRAVDDIRSELNILEINEKFGNIIDTNLIDESRLIANSYLVNGAVNSATSDYYVSEFIPVYGNNVTGNWYMSSSIAGFAVYNTEFEYLRSGKNVATYVYAQGDAYIRCCFKIDSGYKAFYGDALKAYSAFTTDPNREAKEIKELKANTQSTVRPATIKYIGDDENCDYATVQDALSDITDDSENKPYIFYIMPGVYAPFTMKYTDNTRETARIGGARWISLIGLDVTNTIFFDNRGNYKFSPCEVFTNGVIENLTFVDKADVTHFDPYQDRNYAYACHIDFGKCDVRFNNCKFYSNAGPAVGLGTYKDQLLEFYNCRFESDADGTYGSDGLGALFCHVMTSGNAQSDRTNQRLIIHDSIAVATESLNGSRFAVIAGYEGTYFYELQNFGSIGRSGAAVSLTNPDNDLFSDTCFNNVPASLNTIGV